ncbi:hypothetical protein Ddc_08405 [Ditylenchus destructor]|nr:hypothetical protein Ddc_08405 [Ditylenchus destructor]
MVASAGGASLGEEMAAFRDKLVALVDMLADESKAIEERPRFAHGVLVLANNSPMPGEILKANYIKQLDPYWIQTKGARLTPSQVDQQVDRLVNTDNSGSQRSDSFTEKMGIQMTAESKPKSEKQELQSYVSTKEIQSNREFENENPDVAKSRHPASLNASQQTEHFLSSRTVGVSPSSSFGTADKSVHFKTEVTPNTAESPLRPSQNEIPVHIQRNDQIPAKSPVNTQSNVPDSVILSPGILETTKKERLVILREERVHDDDNVSSGSPVPREPKSDPGRQGLLQQAVHNVEIHRSPTPSRATGMASRPVDVVVQRDGNNNTGELIHKETHKSVYHESQIDRTPFPSQNREKILRYHSDDEDLHYSVKRKVTEGHSSQPAPRKTSLDDPIIREAIRILEASCHMLDETAQRIVSMKTEANHHREAPTSSYPYRNTRNVLSSRFPSEVRRTYTPTLVPYETTTTTRLVRETLRTTNF